MFDAIFDMPALTLVLKFMIASTVLLGAVWIMEKTKLLNTPDLAEMAWKVAIAGSFLALLPIGDWISKPITIQHDRTAELVEEFNEGRPLAGMLPMFDPAAKENRSALPQKPEQQPDTRKPEKRTAAGTVAGNLDSRQDTDTPPSGGDTETQALPQQPSLLDTFAALRIKDLAALAWAALAGFALLLLAGGYASAIKGLGSRNRVPAEHEANKALRAICANANIKHVPYLSRSGDIKSPVCLPRREICLPDWAFDDLPTSELNSLLAHEVAHMVRRDPLMLMVLHALSRLFFFQPLFKLARKRLSDIAELSADEWAATHLADARSVAAALYTCAAKIHETRQIQWGLAMAGDKSMLKHRVERLISAGGQPFRKSGFAAKGAVATSLLAITLGLPSIQFAGALSTEMPTTILASSAMHPEGVPSQEEIEAELRRKVEEARAKVAERARVLAKEAKAKGYPTPSEAEIAEEMRQSIAEAEAEIEEQARLIAENAHSFGLDASSDEENGHVRRHITASDGSGMMTWHDGEREIKARWDGDFTLTDDDKAIASMDEGGLLELRTRSGGTKYKARIENPDGKIEITYWKNGKKTSFDKEGEKWLADTLLTLVREVGLNADARVARLLETKGTAAVVKEIEKIRSDYVARVYAGHLVEGADLSSRELKDLVDRFAKMDGDYDMRLALSLLLNEKELDKSVMPKVLKAARTIDSDYELRLLLTPYIDRFGTDNRTMKDLIDVARSIESDYEMRLLLSAAVSEQTLSEGNLERLAEVAASEMESDYELRLLLGSFVKQLSKSRRATSVALKALASMESDYEKRLALSTITEYGAFDNDGWIDAIEAAKAIDSDYDKRLALSVIRTRLPDDKKVQNAFNEAVASIDSDYERKLLSHEEAEAKATAVITAPSTSDIKVKAKIAVSEKKLTKTSDTKVVEAPATSGTAVKEAEKVRYDDRLSRYEAGINLIEGKHCKRKCVIRHPAFKGMQTYDLLTMMERMIDGGLSARGVEVPDYRVTITAIQLEHSLAAINSRISLTGSGSARAAMGAPKGMMRATVELLDPKSGHYRTLHLDTINTQSNYRDFGLNTDAYSTSDLSQLAAHLADTIAHQLAVQVGWQASI